MAVSQAKKFMFGYPPELLTRMLNIEKELDNREEDSLTGLTWSPKNWGSQTESQRVSTDRHHFY